MNLYTFRPFECLEVPYKRTPGRYKKPKARSGHRIACNDQNLYLFGGYNFDDSSVNRPHSLFPELLKFNFVSKEWTLVLEDSPDMPREVASISLFMHGSSILMVCSYMLFLFFIHSFVVFKDLWRDILSLRSSEF